MTARLAADPHLWAITLFDELEPLGFDLSYQTYPRALAAPLHHDAGGHSRRCLRFRREPTLRRHVHLAHPRDLAMSVWILVVAMLPILIWPFSPSCRTSDPVKLRRC